MVHRSASRPPSSPTQIARLPEARSCCTPGRYPITLRRSHPADVIDRTEALTGCPIERAYVDPRRVFISGQKPGVFGAIKRELRRRSAIEPIIGHLKVEGHLGRCYLKGHANDAANVVLSAVGHNFRRILAWLRDFWCLILTALIAGIGAPSAIRSAC